MNNKFSLSNSRFALTHLELSHANEINNDIHPANILFEIKVRLKKCDGLLEWYITVLFVVLEFWISILKISKLLQNCWQWVIDITSFGKHLENSLKLIEIIILWVYYTIPFGLSFFRYFLALFFNFFNYFLWLRITDEGSIPEMRIWSILLIKSDLKWCIHLSKSLYLY